MSIFNISAPTKEQWKKVAKAAAFAFGSTFLATFLAAGGVTVLSSSAVLALLGASAVAGINAVAYALYITFFKGRTEG